MLHGEALPLLVGAVALGFVHGIEPGHGWPVAASYALDRSNEWLYGFAASVLLGIGHLTSSLAMVGAFFYAKSYFRLTRVNEPITVLGDVSIGGPVSIVAGILLVGLGVREYRHGHSHAHGHDHGHSDAHEHGDGDANGHPHDRDDGHDHEHDHDDGRSPSHDRENPRAHGEHGAGRSSHRDRAASTGEGGSDDGLVRRVKRRLGAVGGTSHDHSHDHGKAGEGADRGLFGIAWFAFVLGFAHEEEFEIIGLCAGSPYCLELMTAYALTVLVGIVGVTMLLIAGYREYEGTVRAYTPYLPLFSATVLVGMGIGFVLGVL